MSFLFTFYPVYSYPLLAYAWFSSSPQHSACLIFQRTIALVNHPVSNAVSSPLCLVISSHFYISSQQYLSLERLPWSFWLHQSSSYMLFNSTCFFMALFTVTSLHLFFFLFCLYLSFPQYYFYLYFNMYHVCFAFFLPF